ncbi:MAG: sugar ABC transporter permease [Clostridiales bacterium]|nr:sugar ABC transporter permease [Clostridiales bacterium]
MQARNFYKRKWWLDLLFVLAITIFPVVQFLIFYVGVNLNSILMVFQKYETDPVTNIGAYKFLQGDIFENFKTMFEQIRLDPMLEYAFSNAFLAFFVTVGVGTTLALVFALYIYKKMFFAKTFRLLLFAPSVLSSIIMVRMFQNFTETVLPTLIPSMNGIGLLSNPDTKMFGYLFFTVWTGFGMQILMYSSAMNTIDESIIEAAKLDGVGPFREFVSIIFPLIYPTFITFMVTNLAGLFTNQINLFAFGGSGVEAKYITIGYYLYIKTAAGAGSASYLEYPVLACYGVTMTIVAVPVVLGGKKLMEKLGPKTV